jgi:hypothetical protein
MVEGEHSRLLDGGLRKYWLTVIADSSAAAATVLCEVILIFPVSKLKRGRCARESGHAPVRNVNFCGREVPVFSGSEHLDQSIET